MVRPDSCRGLIDCHVHLAQAGSEAPAAVVVPGTPLDHGFRGEGCMGESDSSWLGASVAETVGASVVAMHRRRPEGCSLAVADGYER
jgi:imidazolonepropionase-like amidohydrolase